MRSKVEYIYLIFALAFGGTGFVVLVAVLLPEAFTGNYEAIFAAFFVLLLFGTVGIVTGSLFISNLLCNIRTKRTIRIGVLGEGMFIDAVSGGTVDNVEYYRIQFSFKDNDGNEHIVKSRACYYKYEVDILRRRRKFEIKWAGSYAVATRAAFLGGTTKEDDPKKTCRYCGGESDATRKRCMHCGASRFVI
jgi:hypothetical protein